jgi:hypothetical protein
MCTEDYIMDWRINGKRELYVRPGEILLGELTFWDNANAVVPIETVKQTQLINHEIVTNL